MPFQPDKVDEHGKVVRKGRGLSDDERTALEIGTSTVREMTRRALRDDLVEKSPSPVPLGAMQRLFDETDAHNVERRRAIAECMGLALSQATDESQVRTDGHPPNGRATV